MFLRSFLSLFLPRFAYKFWYGDGGARRALGIAVPLIMSSSSFTVMMFVDRKFLIGYATDAFRAATPSGMVSFAFLSLFFGTAAYVNTFVAHYTGANRKERVSASIWQGIYFCLMSWAVLVPLYFLAPSIFSLAGHALEVRVLEVKYFRILILGSGFVLLNLVFSSFYSGRGRTLVVMCVRIFAMCLNIPLDYCLIYGKWGFPEMGIEGAALATVISTSITTLIFSILIFGKKNRERFGTLSCWRFDTKLFGRLIRYGLPNGVHFVVEIFGFTFFLLMVGRLGAVELAATNAAWALNMVVFMPMIGFAIGVTTMVGQELGRGRIRVARRATFNSFIMTFTYMATVAMCFVIFPRPLLGFLLSGGEPSDVREITEMAVILLRFVALYSLFDAISIIYASAIKAAGDTRFVMWVSLVVSMATLVIPGYLTTTVWVMPITVTWSFAALYIVVIALVFVWRYRGGRWEKMSVIEKYVPISKPRPALVGQ